MAIGLLRLPSLRAPRRVGVTGAHRSAFLLRRRRGSPPRPRVRIEIEQLAQRRRRTRRRRATPASSLTRTVGACSSLSTTRRTVWAISRALPARPSAQPPGQPGQLGVDHLGRLGPQRDHGRGDPGGALADGRRRPRSATIARTAATSSALRRARRASAPSGSMPTSATPGRPAHGGVDVPRHRQVQEDQRPARPPAASAADHVGRDDHARPRRCRRSPGRPSASGGRPARSTAARPARRRRRPAVRRRSRVRLATAMPAAPPRAAVAAASALIEPAPTTSTSRPARSAPGAATRGARRRARPRRAAGCAGPADPGLGPGPLAGAQREPAELAEHRARPCRAPAASLQRRTHLAEDLALADHHRVQAGRHREQVAHRAVLVVHVQVLGQLVRRHAAVPREQLADGGDAARGTGPPRRRPPPGCRWRRRTPRRRGSACTTSRSSLAACHR